MEHKIVFATKDNKDNLDQDAEIIIILPDDHHTTYNNFPSSVKYIFSCTATENKIKMPFDCVYKKIKKDYTWEGDAILSFTLPYCAKFKVDNPKLKNLMPIMEIKDNEYTYYMRGSRWVWLARYFKTSSFYSVIELEDD